MPGGALSGRGSRRRAGGVSNPAFASLYFKAPKNPCNCVKLSVAFGACSQALAYIPKLNPLASTPF